MAEVECDEENCCAECVHGSIVCEDLTFESVKAKDIERSWFKVMKKSPNHWGKLDGIEDEIAELTGETSKEVNKRLMAIHKQN